MNECNRDSRRGTRPSRIARGAVAVLASVALAASPLGGFAVPPRAVADENAVAAESALTLADDAQEKLADLKAAAGSVTVGLAYEGREGVAVEDAACECAEGFVSASYDPVTGELSVVPLSAGEDVITVTVAGDAGFREAIIEINVKVAAADTDTDDADGSSASDGQEGGDASAGDSDSDGSNSGSATGDTAADSPGSDAAASGSSGDGASAGDSVSPEASSGSDSSATPSVTYPSSGTYTPHHYSRNLTTEKFIAVIGEQARQIGQEQDLYASVMIAQAILESASGNSALAQAPNNNLFGIKGSWKDKSISMLTQEDDGTGLYSTITARFRSYDSITDSLEDYADLLAKGLGGFYQGAWKSNAETPVQACDFLEGRYATSTSYSESLQDLIETYDLARFDEPLDYELVESYEFPVVDEDTGEPVLDEEDNPVTEQRTLADLLAEATSYLGTNYVWGGSTPDVGFDCSGLVQYCYREVLGIELPRTACVQWSAGETVDFEDLHVGDLLFFEEDGVVSHVAMYLGDGYYIHAPQEGDVVKVTSMEEFMPSFAQRVVETRPVGVVPEVEAPVSDEPAVEQPSDHRDPFARLMTPFLTKQAKDFRFLGRTM